MTWADRFFGTHKVWSQEFSAIPRLLTLVSPNILILGLPSPVGGGSVWNLRIP
jgi:hypothetical protein